MKDIFNIIKDTTQYDDSIIEYIKNIFDCDSILTFEINWVKYQHIFYIKQVNINNICDLLTVNIDILELYNLNIKFGIINRLNCSYNQIMNCNNYTLYRLQDAYISHIIESIELSNNWFEYIINIKSTELITILSEYLYYIGPKYDNKLERSKQINIFVSMYSQWTAEYFVKKYNNNKKLTIDDILDKINTINDINKILFKSADQTKFNLILINNILILFKLFLDEVLKTNIYIKENIIKTFIITAETNPKYNKYLLEFTIRWIEQNESVSDSNLLNNLLNIVNIIDNCESKMIINYYVKLYDNRPQLIDYLIKVLDIKIKDPINIQNSKEIITKDINNVLLIISLYSNKKDLWDIYLKYLYERIFYYGKTNNITKDIICYELAIFNIIIIKNCYELSVLVDKHCFELSKPTKQFLDNILQSITESTNFQTCKYNIINANKEKQYIDLSNIDKVNFIMIDKVIYHKYNSTIITKKLISDLMYPSEIKKYLTIGKAYYSKLYEVYNIDYQIEQSIIDISYNNIDIICNIIQYTIIDHIIDHSYTITELINLIAFDKNCIDIYSYLDLYIKNLLTNKILIVVDNKLAISENTIKLDISNVDLNLHKIDKVVELKIDDIHSIEYLRYMILCKMFKHNSTKSYKLENIINDVLNYIEYAKLNTNLQTIFNINIEELTRCINYIEKRDIIEKVNENEYKYVL